MNIDITKGTPDDLPEIEKLYDELNDHLSANTNYPGWKKGIYPTRENARQDIIDGVLFVARSEGRIAGSIVLSHEPVKDPDHGSWMVEAKRDEVLNIYRLAVHPAFLRRGVGTLLLKFADELAAQKNIKSIRLDVYEGNTIAIKAYEKCGYCYIDTVDLGLGCYGLDWFLLYEKPV